MATSLSNNNLMTPYNHFGPSQITDLFINNIMAQRFGDILKENFTFSTGTIMKLILLIFISEIKGTVPSIFSHMVPLLKKSPIVLLLFYSHMIKLYDRLNGKKIIIPVEPEIKRNKELTFTVDINFMVALYNYLHTHIGCKFNKSIVGINIGNTKERILIERITDIEFKNIIIKNPVDYHINMYNKEPVNVEISKIRLKKELTSYMDFFNDRQQQMISKCISDFKAAGFRKEDFLDLVKKSTDVMSEYEISKAIAKNYPSIDVDEMCFIIGLIFSLHKNIYNMFDKVLSCLSKRNTLIFDINNKYKVEEIFKNCNYGSIMTKSFPCDKWTTYNTNDVMNVFGRFVEGQDDANDKYAKTNDLQIEILNTYQKDMSKLLEKFIEKVYKHGKINTSNVKIYYLLLENVVETLEKPNPEYEGWLEKKRMFDEYKQVSKEIGMSSVIDLGNFVIPTKTIVTETSKQKISIKLLNETKKDMGTLYLRKSDKEKLFNSLYQFKDKKDILSNLGLPNKLNILLYGEPGTGKSTTIQAVATYLGKDIYYLDLKEATTNQDLQMMFEYVNKNVPNGGIIVIEDIDAMIDIVLKRKSTKEYKVNDLVSNQKNKLSLEYLLNILQGTLTLDDSIFIVTTNHIDHLDPAFYRDGRFDVKIELKLCDHYQIKCIYEKFMGRKISEEILEKIPENTFSPATIIFHVKDYIFSTDVSDSEILAKFIPR
ncbi:bifunctional AAA family ATPase chaperone/translocase BCS1 [Tupanvirus deep ocean]|uniref:Bifunctional AAA family ATPase chaperone/translocase BCS1 n=2 Tax=Tupanvirus TaxID=2094720 RepID=A0AC62A937_9VIRU|nr:bifunctional AAA family ATPase chaperone/translocase BCS1 [Tupanvirus deep ocean]QKU34188.1 bifunctional AAA family ATPase chaperone/translocase BCS1 [Tupanvirus deep ocean]